MRAALTILGVAVGVFVVVVISAAIHGINASVAQDFEKAGPTTFFAEPLSDHASRACDGTDDTCKWLRNPRLTFADAKALERALDRSRGRAQIGISGAKSLQGPRPELARR